MDHRLQAISYLHQAEPVIDSFYSLHGLAAHLSELGYKDEAEELGQHWRHMLTQVQDLESMLKKASDMLGA